MSPIYPREMLQRVYDEMSPPALESTRQTINQIVDTVFFASQMMEEGEPVRVAVVQVEGGADALATIDDSSGMDWGGEPPLAWRVTKISRRAFTVGELAKLSKGLHFGAGLIVVGGVAPELWIDGIARRVPETNGGAVARIAAPRAGVLVFEQEDWEVLRYEAGEQMPTALDILSESGPVQAQVAAICGGERSGSPAFVLGRLLQRMRATGTGGILALAPEIPFEMLQQPQAYRFDRPDSFAKYIGEFMAATQQWVFHRIAESDVNLTADDVEERDARAARRESAWTALDSAIDEVGQLSSVDGAVLMGQGLTAYGAGFLIRGQAGNVQVVEADDAAAKTTKPFDRRHGARHLAGITFAAMVPGGVAFVVSEDGPVRCMMKLDERVVLWRVRIPET